MKKLSFTICLVLCIANLFAQSTITRGTEEGEIYIFSYWYSENDEFTTAIWRSNDNGKTLNLQYQSTASAPSGQLAIDQLLGDASPGVVYKYAYNELWVSFDYGESWTYRETCLYNSFASGYEEGTIFKRDSYNLYKSINYGESFYQIVENLDEPLSDVGNDMGELFGFSGISENQYNLYFSKNEGLLFSQIPIDSTIAYYYINGNSPNISRGTESGEIYLVSWWPDYHYKIFHSLDTGYNWTEKHESAYNNTSLCNHSYTAGRKPGSFYVLKDSIPLGGDHFFLEVMHSEDYGATFTTYTHELVPSFAIKEASRGIKKSIACYPNPFSSTATFTLPQNINKDKTSIEIFNAQGKLIKRIGCSSNRASWDGTNQNGSGVANGMYLYRVNSTNYISKPNKILFLNQ